MPFAPVTAGAGGGGGGSPAVLPVSPRRLLSLTHAEYASPPPPVPLRLGSVAGARAGPPALQPLLPVPTAASPRHAGAAVARSSPSPELLPRRASPVQDAWAAQSPRDGGDATSRAERVWAASGIALPARSHTGGADGTDGSPLSPRVLEGTRTKSVVALRSLAEQYVQRAAAVRVNPTASQPLPTWQPASPRAATAVALGWPRKSRLALLVDDIESGLASPSSGVADRDDPRTMALERLRRLEEERVSRAAAEMQREQQVEEDTRAAMETVVQRATERDLRDSFAVVRSVLEDFGTQTDPAILERLAADARLREAESEYRALLEDVMGAAAELTRLETDWVRMAGAKHLGDLVAAAGEAAKGQTAADCDRVHRLGITAAASRQLIASLRESEGPGLAPRAPKLAEALPLARSERALRLSSILLLLLVIIYTCLCALVPSWITGQSVSDSLSAGITTGAYAAYFASAGALAGVALPMLATRRFGLIVAGGIASWLVFAVQMFTSIFVAVVTNATVGMILCLIGVLHIALIPLTAARLGSWSLHARAAPVVEEHARRKAQKAREKRAASKAKRRATVAPAPQSGPVAAASSGGASVAPAADTTVTASPSATAPQPAAAAAAPVRPSSHRHTRSPERRRHRRSSKVAGLSVDVGDAVLLPSSAASTPLIDAQHAPADLRGSRPASPSVAVPTPVRASARVVADAEDTTAAEADAHGTGVRLPRALSVRAGDDATAADTELLPDDTVSSRHDETSPRTAPPSRVGAADEVDHAVAPH